MRAHHILVALFFQQFFSAAIPGDIQHFQVFGDRRDHVAVAAGDGRQHGFDALLLHQATVLGQHFVRAGAFVDETGRQLDAAYAAIRVDVVDDDFRSRFGRHAKDRGRAG